MFSGHVKVICSQRDHFDRKLYVLRTIEPSIDEIQRKSEWYELNRDKVERSIGWYLSKVTPSKT